MSVKALIDPTDHKDVGGAYHETSPPPPAALWQELVISGVSVGGASTFTNPLGKFFRGDGLHWDTCRQYSPAA
jgi:hypothetical protein